MQKIYRYLLAICSIMLLIPAVIIPRSVLSNNLSASDILFIVAITAHLGLIYFMVRLSEDSTTIFAAEERKGFYILIGGTYILAAGAWVLVSTTGAASFLVLISAAIALAYGCYDLLQIARTVPGPQQLKYLSFVSITVPLVIAFALTFISSLPNQQNWVLNPVSVFFILRAVIPILFR